MLEILLDIAKKVEDVEPTAHCLIDKMNCQIIVTFDKRNDTEIALLTPYAQREVKKGHLDDDLYSDMLFSVRKIANYAL